MVQGWTRREFLRVGSAGLALGLSGVLRAQEAQKPLRCAFTGVGGRGHGLAAER